MGCWSPLGCAVPPQPLDWALDQPETFVMNNNLPATPPRLAARKVLVHAFDHDLQSQLVHP